MLDRRLVVFAFGMASSLLAQHPDAAGAAAPAGPNEYEVFYHHVVRNKTDRGLTDVVACLPVPASDGYRTVGDFHVDRNTKVHISNRADAFGTRIKCVEIAAIPPRGEAHVGFSWS